MPSESDPQSDDENRDVSLAWKDLLLVHGFRRSEDDETPKESAAARSVKRARGEPDSWDNLGSIPVELSTDPPLVSILRLLENSNMLHVCGSGSKALERRQSEALYSDVNDVIHTQTFAYESKILTENVEIRLPNGGTARSMPCFFGQRCQGMSPQIKGHERNGGVVLREYMNPKELDAFHATGALPLERRPCLLCMRSQIHYAYMCVVQSSHHFPNPSVLINGFVNPRDVADGYSSDFMIPREERPTFQGLAGFVCVAEKHLLSWRHNNGVWEIDQSKLRARDTYHGDAQSPLRETNSSSVETELVDRAVSVSRAYFKHRVNNIEELTERTQADYSRAQERLVQLLESHGEELPNHVERMLYVLLDHFVVCELRPRAHDPTALRVLCIDTLPDITDCVYRAFLSRETAGHRSGIAAASNRPFSECFVHILCKCVPRACHMRSLTTILNRYTKDVPPLLDLLVDVVQCGLLGNFDDGNARACLVVRRAVYESTAIIRDIMSANFSKNSDDMFLLFCIREYMHATVSRCRALDAVIATFMPAWRTLHACVLTVGDSCRVSSARQLSSASLAVLREEGGRRRVLTQHVHNCGNYMRMTNRSLPRLALPHQLRIVIPFTPQPCLGSGLFDPCHLRKGIAKAIAHLADGASDQGHHRTGRFDPMDLLVRVKNQLAWLCRVGFEQEETLAMDPSESALLRSHTALLAQAIVARNVPSLVRLPLEVRKAQVRSLRRRQAHAPSLTYDARERREASVLYVCLFCGKVKNIMEKGSSGLDMAVFDDHDGRVYCAEKSCSSCAEVPLLRVVLTDDQTTESFACVFENAAHAVCPSCGEVRRLDMSRLLSDRPSERGCDDCRAGERETVAVSEGSRRKRKDGVPRSTLTCFHCGAKVNGRAKAIRLRDPGQPTGELT
eukprot:gene26000-31832_t